LAIPILPDFCAAVHLLSDQTNSQQGQHGASPQHAWRIVLGRLQFHLVDDRAVGVSAMASTIFFGGFRLICTVKYQSPGYCFFLHIYALLYHCCCEQKKKREKLSRVIERTRRKNVHVSASSSATHPDSSNDKNLKRS
jgi:hypothetical protein